MTQLQEAESGQRWPAESLEQVPVCPACGGGARRLLYSGLKDRLFPTPGDWSLWRCLGCRSAYLDPRPTEASIRRAYSSYVTHEPPAEEGGARAPLGELRRRVMNGYLRARYGYPLRPAIGAGGWLVPLLPYMAARTDRWIRGVRFEGRPPRILDVGCGNGEFLLFMRALGCEVHGIDVDEEAVRHANTAGLTVRVATIADLGPNEERFDAITLGHVIEHLHDPLVTLGLARDLLRPGGMLWLATPNIAALGHRLFRRSWFGLDPPRHLVLFSPPALASLLASAGFARVEARQPVPAARALFPTSEAIARDLNPLSATPQLPAGLRLRQTLAEAIAWRRHDAAEELIFAAFR